MALLFSFDTYSSNALKGDKNSELIIQSTEGSGITPREDRGSELFLSLV